MKITSLFFTVVDFRVICLIFSCFFQETYEHVYGRLGRVDTSLSLLGNHDDWFCGTFTILAFTAFSPVLTEPRASTILASTALSPVLTGHDP